MVDDLIRLTNSSVEIELGAARPVAVSYRGARSGATLAAAEDGAGLEVLVFDEEARAYRSSSEAGFFTESAVRADGSSAVYDFVLRRGGKAVAEFRVSYSLVGNCLTVRCSLRSETESVRVTSIRIPLVSVGASQHRARMAFPTRSGRLVDVAACQPMERVHKIDWFEMVQVAMAYHDGMLALLSLDSPDDQIISRITDRPKAGSISVEFVFRPKAEDPALLFQVQSESSCSVTLLEPDGVGPIDWTAGAAVARDRIPQNINDLYVGAFVYKIFLDRPGASDWMTFADALEFVKRVARLTGGARQIAYLVGWQHSGHDTGYPDVFTINPRVGDLAGLRKLIEQAKAENAIVSLHDNYHDAYMDSPAWDPSIVARDSRGELAEGGIWDGGQAYVIGPAKYAPQAVERARKTIEMTGIEQTVHLDVFTDDPDRVDFDPKCPASRRKNLDGKMAILSEFKRLGIDVTSEILTAPFTGCMSHFWRVEMRRVPCWSAEERIPLVPMIFHGKVTAGGTAATDDDMLDLIECGWTFSADLDKGTTDRHIMDLYYLVTVPWSILAKREITGFEKNGPVERVWYDRDTYVQVDRERQSYDIVVDGVAIARDFSTNARLPDGRTVSYSRCAGAADASQKLGPEVLR